MNLSIALLALRGAALGLQLQGQTGASRTLNLLADSAAAGLNVDAHMAEVAAKLKAGEPIDWDDVEARIRADSTDLHSPPPG